MIRVMMIGGFAGFCRSVVGHGVERILCGRSNAWRNVMVVGVGPRLFKRFVPFFHGWTFFGVSVRCRLLSMAVFAIRLWLFPDVSAGGSAILDEQAGSDPELWAYRPPEKSATPQPLDLSWPRNDIDQFILAKLESRGLRPVQAAESSVLARRLYFDLIGLPPTPEQIDERAGDLSPDRVATVVNRLLGSPQFGERWARHWLDVVRYAESLTLRGFVFNEAWRYRDYVVEIFNRDIPYDQFLREQIAGDLLRADSVAEKRRQSIATTFLVLGNINLEEQDKKQLDMDVVDEQLDTIGKTFLGQTIGCARCHDHKFDPVPTRDYYAMAGILRGVQTLEHANVSKWLELPLPVEPAEEKRLQQHEAAVTQLQGEIKLAKERAAKLGVAATGSGKDKPLDPAQLPGLVVDDTRASRVGEWIHSRHTKSYVGDGYLHDGDTDKGQKTVTFHAERLRAGRYEVRLSYTPGNNRAPRVPVDILHADGESTVYVNEQEVPAIDGRFVSLGQFRFEANGQGYVLISNEGTGGHVIADAVQFLPLDGNELPLAKTETRSTSEVEERSIQEKKRSEEEIRQLEARLKKLVESGPRRQLYMSVKESGGGDIRVHRRGSVHTLGDVVPRGFLAAAGAASPSISVGESGRREFTEWLASPANPLTARVMVNRVWHWLFGAGLVRTPDNFGTTGDRPSHPELLDFLAVRFMEEGWSVKKLVREIVLSRAYQLSSSEESVECATDVPENRLLWRAYRRRAEADVLRDAILQVSGQLQLDGGGPSIKSGTTADYGYTYTDKTRSVYVPVFRNALLDFFDTFDFPNPSMVTGRRDSSTVAPQALYLMNHPFIMEQAQSAARRFLALSAPDNSVRLDRAYRIALGRFPTSDEREVALKYLSLENSEAERLEQWTQLSQALFASLDFRYIE